MKIFILVAIGLMALFFGLKAALLWRESTNVLWSPNGPEPVDPDIRRAWSDVARYEQSNQVNELNRRAAKWTAAAAVASFFGLIAGLWPT